VPITSSVLVSVKVARSHPNSAGERATVLRYHLQVVGPPALQPTPWNKCMSDADMAINEIKALENRRYRAMIDGDTAVYDALCSDDGLEIETQLGAFILGQAIGHLR
jgi:hypothetical protein